MKRLAVILAIFLSVPALADVDFDNSDDSIGVGSGAVIDAIYNGNFTFSLWLKPDTLATADIMIFKGLAGTASRTFSFNADGAIRLFASGSTSLDILTNNSTVAAGNVYHVVLIGNWASITATDYKIYVNGAEASYQTQTNGNTLTSMDAYSCYIGANNAGTNPFDGFMYEVAMWNTQLSVVEIGQLYAARQHGMPLQIQAANLKAYWMLDDIADGTSGDGDLFLDSSGNGVTGTGDDGAGNAGLTCYGSTHLSYP